MLRIRIRDPVPFDPWIRDPGWVKNQVPGSGRNIPDRIPESLEPIFCVENTDPEPGSEIFSTVDSGSGSRDKHPGSATLVKVMFHLLLLEMTIRSSLYYPDIMLHSLFPC